MKTYYFVAETNIDHPILETKIDPIYRAASYISRSFHDPQTAYDAISEDVTIRLAKFIKNGNLPVKVSEVNPTRVNDEEQLAKSAANDEKFARYLDTWDEELVSRITITDECVESSDEVNTDVSYEDMPPKDYILRYYIREYEDGIEVPHGVESLMLMPEMMQ